jgi:1-deoxy-D-xylulose-5-phosphate synthase
LVEAGRANPRVVAITAAMPDSTGLDEFRQVFPRRAFDVGIAEQHATTFAAGLASEGLRPVFLVYSTFLQRGYDQVVNDVCHQNLPVVFGIDRAGLVGSDGATHQGVFDIAFLRTVPNITIAMGKDEAETRQLMLGALEQPGPVAVRYPRGAGRGVSLDDPPGTLPWGRAGWERHGQDVTLVAFGPIVHEALAAADELSRRGYRVGVLNARFAKPLDTEALTVAATDSALLVTLEEHVVTGGFGSAVMEWAQAAGLTVPVRVMALDDEFIDHGSPARYLSAVGLDKDGIAARVTEWLPRHEKRA